MVRVNVGVRLVLVPQPYSIELKACFIHLFNSEVYLVNVKVRDWCMRVSLFGVGILCGFFLVWPLSVSFADESPISNEAMHIFSFDIQGQDLQEALLEFATQANVNIVFPVEIVLDKTSPPIVGRYQLAQALSLILSKTALVFEVNADNGSVVIKKNHQANRRKVRQPLSEQAGTHIEEVQIVTARYREESMFMVPMSMSRISGDTLKQIGIQSLVELSGYFPNSSLRILSGTSTSMTGFIRGRGIDEPLPGTESSVGIYIDDVYLDRPQSVLLEIYDAERIEILRGPQGTLYGHNTIGGAIRYITKKLDDELLLDTTITLGSFNQRSLLLKGSAPVSDSLKVGASLISTRHDGFGDNLTTGHRNYDKNLRAGRVSIEYSPTEMLFFRVVGDISSESGFAKSGYRLEPLENEERLENVFDTRAGVEDTSHPIDSNDIEKSGVAISASWEIGDFFELKSISSYREDESDILNDFDSLPGSEAGDLYSEYINRQTTQELRLLFDSENIKAIFGVYYLRGFAHFAADNVSTLRGFVGFSSLDVNSRDWAVFSTIDMSLSDAFNVELGLRYTKDKKTISRHINGYSAASSGELISPFFGGDGIPIFSAIFDEDGAEVFPGFRGSRSDDDYTPRLSFGWHPQKDTTVYASYSQGFRSGGYDPRGFFTDEQVRSGYDAETVGAYELGFKASIFEEKLSLYSAVFYSRYRNIQNYVSRAVDVNGDGIPDLSTLVIQNNLNAEIRGLEIEVNAQVSPWFNVDVSLGLLDAEYKGGIEQLTIDGSTRRVFQNTPDTTLAVRMSYHHPFERLDLLVYGAMRYQSSTYVAAVEISSNYQGGFSLFDAGLALVFSGGDWELVFSGKNLSDKRYLTSSFWGATSSVVGFYGDPRTLTGALKYSF